MDSCIRARKLATWAVWAGLLTAAPSGRAQEVAPDSRPPAAMTAVQGPSSGAPDGIPAEPLPLPPEGLVPGQESTPAQDTIPAQDSAPGAADQAAGSAGQTTSQPPSLWSKVPPVTPLPRAGWFLIPPSGAGYYSFRDVLEGNYRENPPKFPYPPLTFIQFPFFDVDYRYLEDPKNTQFDWVDPIKRIHLGDNWLLSIGGEERIRFMHEEGGYVRLHGTDNDYGLLRSRVYGDLWFRDIFRVFVEYIDARISGQDLAPLPIDVNHSDLLNLFIDLKLFELADHPFYVRGGRQELLYGSQRLISPLDWANTRRTFQGVKGFWHGDKWDIDAFWVQPIIINPTHFDSPDDAQQFVGLWTTYKPRKGTTADFYYLYLDNTRPVAIGRYGARDGFNVSTFGSRCAGDYNQVLWDFEGMYQFGDWANQGISAGAVATGLGYQFAKVPMNPQFWIYNEWASGDHKPGNSALHGTFNQLFPFGHYYFGYLDLVGRQNIDDLSMQFAFYPTKWILTYLQYHIFRLDSARDALYNSAGTAIRRDPTGRAGTDVGDEIDLVTNFHLSQHQDIAVGYSKLYAGAFIRRTGPSLSPDLFYLQYSFKW